MVLSALLALLLSNALQAFGILLQIGAGTGLIFILRWFWWRINAWSEISAMIVSFAVALYLQILHPMITGSDLGTSASLLIGVFVTTLTWVLVTLFTQPTDYETLKSFYEKIQSAGKGWNALKRMAKDRNDTLLDTGISGRLSLEILAMVVGCTAIYSTLFAMGYWLYGNTMPAMVLTVIATGTGYGLFRLFKLIRMN